MRFPFHTVRKIIIAGAVTVMFTVPLKAQVTFGPRIGANFARYSEPVVFNLTSPEIKPLPDLHLGVSVDCWLQKKIALQTGAFYSAGGQEFKDKSYTIEAMGMTDTLYYKYNGSFQASWIKVPLLFTYDNDGPPGFGKDDGAFDGFRAEAGIYAAYMMKARLKEDVTYKMVQYDTLGNKTGLEGSGNLIDEEIGFEDGNIRRLDLGIQFGFGIEKSVGIGTLLVNFNFNFGLLDLYKLEESQQPPNYKPAHYRDWGISLTYFFPSFEKEKSVKKKQ